MTERDRLRELLDATLGEDNATLEQMAGDAYSSPYHFARQLSRGAGEPPVAMRRRVMLERAAWQLRGGASVTDAAFAAGYESVEGFSRAFARAFGHLPSEQPDGAGHWLPAPNGIHFHPPVALWVDSGSGAGTGGAAQVVAHLVEHDLDDVRELLDLAKGLDGDALERELLPGHVMLAWDGPETCLGDVLDALVRSKEVWLASIEGVTAPARPVPRDVAGLLARHDAVAPRWLAVVRDVDRRGAWGDRLVDALCEPPESFVLGSVLAHVLTFSAARRQLARMVLRSLGVEVDHGDPIDWLRRTTGGAR